MSINLFSRKNIPMQRDASLCTTKNEKYTVEEGMVMALFTGTLFVAVVVVIPLVSREAAIASTHAVSH